MIAVDTNLLVYAHREESPVHEAAARSMRGLAAGDVPWSIPWPCVAEFLCVVTHPRLFAPPTAIGIALQAVEEYRKAPSVVFLGEGEEYWTALANAIRGAESRGPAVYDARIAALCIAHGVTELWTADRDYSRFPGLRTRNPLV